MTKEYIVSLKADVDYNAFWNEIENDGNTNLFIPDRRVDIVNERPGSLRSCHYALTDLGDQSAALYSNIFSLKVDLSIFGQ